jgi:hypothetical protein
VTAAEVLRELWRRGLRCIVTPAGVLKVGPTALLTDEDRGLIREHLDELRALLAPDDVEWLLEREGILIFDAGIDPHEAAVQAAEMLMQWESQSGRAPA